MKRQVIVVGGGDAYRTYEDYISFLKNWEIDFEKFKAGKKRWKDNLADDLGGNFDVVSVGMPNKMNAQYEEWKIWFEKFIPHFDEGVILLGHSLGGTFLAKYLSENKFPKKIAAVFLAAPVFDAEGMDESLGDFIFHPDISGLEGQAGKIFLYHSEDDRVVPFANLGKFQNALRSAIVRTFKDRGHFDQEHFPEIVSDIKSL